MKRKVLTKAQKDAAEHDNQAEQLDDTEPDYSHRRPRLAPDAG
jgi:hypothetical protein